MMFRIIEIKNSVVSYINHTSLDERIPFVSAFIIPYFLWFFFIAATFLYFIVVRDNEDAYRRFSNTIFFGCTAFIVVSVFFPNGQDLRPVVTGSGIFARIPAFLYSIDTPTNVFPSIHVFNSIACCAAILRDEVIGKMKTGRLGTLALTISIVLATMFLKQHSVIDVMGAILLNLICDRVFYGVRRREVARRRVVESRRV